MDSNKFWLVSNSPRRREILSWAGWRLEKMASNGDEAMLAGETPEQYVRRIAVLKSGIELKDAAAGDFIISADTIVVLDE